MAPAYVRCTLDEFAREMAASEGINIREVEPFTMLLVQSAGLYLIGGRSVRLCGS
jgi:hypothetical protein